MKALALALATLLGAATATAGVRFHAKSERADRDGAPDHVTIWVDGDRLAVEARRPKAPPAPRRIVFRGTEDVLWFLDASKRSYYQLDPESAKQAVEQIQGLRQGLEAGLDALGPEQSARARELLGGLVPAAEAEPLPELSLRPLGTKAVHAELSCERMEVAAGSERMAEVCVAAFGQGVLQRDRLQALPALGGFLDRTIPPLLAAFPSLRALAPLTSLAGTDGVPIRARTFGDGTEETVTTLHKAKAIPIDPALFEIPEGYGRSWIPPF